MEQLDPQRQRVQDDLRGLVAGEVRCDAALLELYATDGGIYHVRPLAVVCPRSAADVAAAATYAAQRQIPLAARGGGTATAGHSLTSGLVVDFARNLRRIVRTEGDVVRVQAGVVHERLNAHLATRGRMFAPDPGTSPVTTIGGMIGINAAGRRRRLHGDTRAAVISVQAVLADGTVMELGREPKGSGDEGRKARLVAAVAAILGDNQSLIQRHQAAGRCHRAGYELSGVLSEGHVDLAKLLVGSEGTLALVTEATLRTVPLARHRGLALLLFEGLEVAARTALELSVHAPSACELMDRRHLSLLRESDERLATLISPEAEAALLVEYEGDRPLEVRQRLQDLVDDVRHENRRAFGARQAFDPAEVDFFRQMTAAFQPAYRVLKGPAKAANVVEDMAVPPDALAELLVRLQNVLKRHDVPASLTAQALQGQVRLRPLVDLSAADSAERIKRLADDLYAEVLELGGAVGGELGCGIARTPYMARQYGPLAEVFRQIKDVFDPGGVLNPGKIVASPAAPSPALRPAVTPAAGPAVAAPQLRNLVEVQLNWDPARVSAAADACTGCGACRTQAASRRMCPIFRFSPSEESSPRAKANVLRGVLGGQLELGILTSPEFKQIADLCVHCHMCRLECPANVDIPSLMRESKGAHVAANGLSAADWLMTRLDLVGALATRVSRLANWAIGSPRFRWLLEKTLGIAQGRKLPRVARASFVRSARRRLLRPTRRSGHKVLYFVDVYANHFDVQLAEAFVAVLEHNGVEVYVHPDQQQAGMPAIARGALDYARGVAHHNVGLLAEAVRQGYHIVATEPSASLCLKREYPQLLEDDDAAAVAEHSSDACAYLWRMHTLGQLQLDFRPLNVSMAYHAPCHLKALGVGLPGRNLLDLIPGLHVRTIDAGCSGMAGTYGLMKKNYRNSLRAGWGLIAGLRHHEIQAGATECSTCKMQMEQGTVKPTLHPVKLLAMAYGLVPAAGILSPATSRERVVT